MISGDAHRVRIEEGSIKISDGIFIFCRWLLFLQAFFDGSSAIFLHGYWPNPIDSDTSLSSLYVLCRWRRQLGLGGVWYQMSSLYLAASAELS